MVVDAFSASRASFSAAKAFLKWRKPAMGSHLDFKELQRESEKQEKKQQENKQSGDSRMQYIPKAQKEKGPVQDAIVASLLGGVAELADGGGEAPKDVNRSTAPTTQAAAQRIAAGRRAPKAPSAAAHVLVLRCAQLPRSSGVYDLTTVRVDGLPVWVRTEDECPGQSRTQFLYADKSGHWVVGHSDADMKAGLCRMLNCTLRSAFPHKGQMPQAMCEWEALLPKKGWGEGGGDHEVAREWRLPRKAVRVVAEAQRDIPADWGAIVGHFGEKYQMKDMSLYSAESRTLLSRGGLMWRCDAVLAFLRGVVASGAVRTVRMQSYLNFLSMNCRCMQRVFRQHNRARNRALQVVFKKWVAEDAEEIRALSEVLHSCKVPVREQRAQIRRFQALSGILPRERQAALLDLYRARQIIPCKAREAWLQLPEQRRRELQRWGVSLKTLKISAPAHVSSVYGDLTLVAQGQDRVLTCNSLLPCTSQTLSEARTHLHILREKWRDRRIMRLTGQLDKVPAVWRPTEEESAGQREFWFSSTERRVRWTLRLLDWEPPPSENVQAHIDIERDAADATATAARSGLKNPSLVGYEVRVRGALRRSQSLPAMRRRSSLVGCNRHRGVGLPAVAAPGGNSPEAPAPEALRRRRQSVSLPPPPPSPHVVRRHAADAGADAPPGDSPRSSAAGAGARGGEGGSPPLRLPPAAPPGAVPALLGPPPGAKEWMAKHGVLPPLLRLRHILAEDD